MELDGSEQLLLNGLHRTKVDWTAKDWTGLDYTSVDCTGLD